MDVVEVATPTGASDGSSPAQAAPAPGGRRITRVRGLPGGRAVVGALLVAGAIVATFVAYLDAATVPTRDVVIATAVVEPGTRLASLEDVAERFGTVPVELQGGDAADGLVTAADVESLIGRTVVAPLQPGDLLLGSQVVADGGMEGAYTLSFALSRTAAVGGALQPGERIDVLGTFGAGDGAYTAFVVRSVPLLRVTAPDGGTLGASSDVTLTVAITDPADVQALGHAVNTAEVFVVRSSGEQGASEAAPGAYRAEPRDQGPLPEPAGPVSRAEPGSP